MLHPRLVQSSAASPAMLAPPQRKRVEPPDERPKTQHKHCISNRNILENNNTVLVIGT